ncbi:hypothetical protein KAK06_05210 [Ideonella sp. 4Y11]|uniref:Uncharacterized protein n=1 Tax=Ideonella aquatica TaxID=2824119 RepID=A0A941BKA0_9BURK|nr:hypothetical protein [Ideonella aquatica]MBQ0958349.1 hypothetical protein [Ideonella aquatica]
MVQTSPLPLLITTSVVANAPRTAVAATEERLALTLEGLERWLRLRPELAYVVCDGSGFDLREQVDDLCRRVAPSASVEVLHFVNDQSQVQRRGKGFGEGEIVQFALAHGRTLQGATRFAKCTGKLWISNLAAVEAWNRQQPASFDYRGRLRPVLLDTRFYLCDLAFYRDRLATAHHQVDEPAGVNLEHCFARALATEPLFRYAMLPPPIIHGVSGSMGVRYDEFDWHYARRLARAAVVRGLRWR